MNKYRTHNCSQLREGDKVKKLSYLGGYIVSEITEIYYL